MKTDAERRQLTVLFCDLVNSTQLSAALDPEDMRHVLDRFLATCAEAIARFGGVVGNYLGDGVLAYFGYPTAHEDDAERAVHAGLALIANVGRLNAHPGITLQTRIGIATGLVVAGDIVANPERAVVGETLNLAARLHELAAPDGVVVADSTAKLLGRSFRLQPAPPAPLKGFAEPVPHWLVTGQGEQRTRFAARRPESLPLIGRDDDLAAMRARARAAWAGPGAATLLRGEAGIGKSRLAAAFAADPGLDPGAPKRLVVTYQCSPYHVESVLYPFRAEFMLTNRLTPRDPPANHFAAVRRALEITRPRDPDALALIATLLAIPPAGLYPALLLSPAEQRRRWLAIIIDMLASVAAQRPLLILFEDAHWADATSLELLGAMIDKLSDIPAYIIITARPEFAAPWQTSPLVETRDLGHLDQPSILALVRRVCAERRLDEQTERDIAARADGIPLFAEELARSLMDAGEAAARTGHAPEIPATLKDSLTARLDRLGPAKDIAQMGAAICSPPSPAATMPLSMTRWPNSKPRTSSPPPARVRTAPINSNMP
jgi:class 3 adenylate cyclase